MRFGKEIIAGVCTLIVGVVAYLLVTHVSVDILIRYAQENRILGAALLASFMFVSTVVAPLTTLPLLPIVAPFLGPFTTACASIIGWTLGSVVAFLIARHGGRPLIGKYVPLAGIEAYESRVPAETQIVLLIVLRIVMPVDILSYALGLFSRVSLRVYTCTTLVGVSWFACIFAYLGNAAYTGDYVLLGALGVASVIIFMWAYMYVRKHMPENK